MGRRSRRTWERRERRAQEARGQTCRDSGAGQQSDRVAELEAELNRRSEGRAVCWNSPECPEDVRLSYTEDVLAFESVDSGTSLFDGLQQHGLDLPPPEKLDERQCLEKVAQVLTALAELGVFVIGLGEASPRKVYSTLWHETLWEGCYVEKRNPGAITLIDIFHSMSQAEMMELLEDLQKSSSVQ